MSLCPLAPPGWLSPCAEWVALCGLCASSLALGMVWGSGLSLFPCPAQRGQGKAAEIPKAALVYLQGQGSAGEAPHGLGQVLVGALQGWTWDTAAPGVLGDPRGVMAKSWD